MNSQIFTRVKIYTKVLLALMSLSFPALAEGWKIDFSRRSKQDAPKELVSADEGQAPATGASPGFFASLFDSSEPVQEMVILNTDKGFLPSTVRVRENGNYRIHVVNVNEREKNVSFVLDAFSEHHATYFGKIKTFEIRPKKTGVFRFVSPETSAQGRLVVSPATDPGLIQGAEVRAPANE